MKKQHTPLIVGLIAIIVVAAGIIYRQMRPSTSTDSTATMTDTPGASIAGQPQGGQSPPTGAASPTDEARARGEFTPAPK